MIDRLKQSIEGIASPRCPDCHTGMLWYRSMLVSDILPATVAYFFQCANCNRLHEEKTRCR